MTITVARTRAVLSAEHLTIAALVNCLLREVAHPAGRAEPVGDGSLVVDLPNTGATLRVDVAGVPPMWRSTGRAWQACAGQWRPLTWEPLARLIDDELGAAAGDGSVRISTLVDEVRSSHGFMSGLLGATTGGPAAEPDPYLQSEQSLIAGHRYHPAPKARSGPSTVALRWAPERGSSFQVHYLAADPEIIWQREARPGAGDVFDTQLVDRSAGIHLLPVHPWQYDILMRGRALPAALRSGVLTDVGPLGPPVHPTSSVRTVMEPSGPEPASGSGHFLKLSLSVQLTNCLRINPLHEATAAVALTRLFEPLRSELAQRFPGTVLVREPAARSAVNPVRAVAGQPDGQLADQLGVIAREALVARPGVQLTLAAALTEPHPAPAVERLLAAMTRDRETLVACWDQYLALVVPPVLHAWFVHGVVLEAHLQNVVVGLPAPGDQGDITPESVPGQVFLRDLEGCKLAGPRYLDQLAHLPAAVRDHVSYDPGRGWSRVAYCLFVNHISGVLAALADRAPAGSGGPERMERILWSRVRETLRSLRSETGNAPELHELLRGGAVPAKTNLLTRWQGIADRQSVYVPVRLPLT